MSNPVTGRSHLDPYAQSYQIIPSRRETQYAANINQSDVWESRSWFSNAAHTVSTTLIDTVKLIANKIWSFIKGFFCLNNPTRDLEVFLKQHPEEAVKKIEADLVGVIETIMDAAANDPEIVKKMVRDTYSNRILAILTLYMNKRHKFFMDKKPEELKAEFLKRCPQSDYPELYTDDGRPRQHFGNLSKAMWYDVYKVVFGEARAQLGDLFAAVFSLISLNDSQQTEMCAMLCKKIRGYSDTQLANILDMTVLFLRYLYIDEYGHQMNQDKRLGNLYEVLCTQLNIREEDAKKIVETIRKYDPKIRTDDIPE